MYYSLCTVESPCIRWYAVLGEVLAWSFFDARQYCTPSVVATAMRYTRSGETADSRCVLSTHEQIHCPTNVSPGQNYIYITSIIITDQAHSLRSQEITSHWSRNEKQARLLPYPNFKRIALTLRNFPGMAAPVPRNTTSLVSGSNEDGTCATVDASVHGSTSDREIRAESGPAKAVIDWPSHTIVIHACVWYGRYILPPLQEHVLRVAKELVRPWPDQPDPFCQAWEYIVLGTQDDVHSDDYLLVLFSVLQPLQQAQQ